MALNHNTTYTALISTKAQMIPALNIALIGLLLNSHRFISLVNNLLLSLLLSIQSSLTLPCSRKYQTQEIHKV
jgi:hypothetical protein